MLNHTAVPTTEFPADMDPECVPLCSAINHLPGVETVESCCGHGRGPFRVWVKTRMQYDLAPLLFHMLYSGPAWHARVQTDGTMMPVTFQIRGPVMGEEGEENATPDKLAETLQTWIEENQEILDDRRVAPKRVVRCFSGTSGNTERVSLQIGHYGHNLGYFMTLFELAKVDFPFLVLSDVEVVQYGGDRIRGYWGLEFNADAQRIPDSYERVDRLEPTF